MELYSEKPENLAYDPIFWFSHWKVTIFSVIMVIVLFFIFPLLIQDNAGLLIPYEGWLASVLKAAIVNYPWVFIIIAVFAFISAMKILAVVEVNLDIAKRVHRNSEEYVNTENVHKMEHFFHEIDEENTNDDNDNLVGKDAKLNGKTGFSKEQIINKLIHAILPGRTATPEPEMVSMARSIANDARIGLMDRDQNYISPFREKGHEQLQRLEDLQKLSLRLGILGTFVGLLFSIAVIIPLFTSELSEIDLSQKNTITEQLTAKIHETKRSMESLSEAFTIAFGTSILGIVIAIFSAMLLRYVDGRQTRYMSGAEEASHDLVLAIHLALVIGNERVTGSDRFERFQTEMRQVYTDAYEKLALILGKMENTQEGICNKINSFESYVSNIDDANKKFFQNFKKDFDISQICQAFTHTNEVLQKKSDLFVDSNLKVLESFSKDVSSIADTYEKLPVTLGKMKTTQEEICDKIGDFGSYVSGFDDANKKFVEEFKAVFDISQMRQIYNHTNNVLQENSDSFIRSNLKVIDSFSRDASTMTNTTTNLSKQVEDLKKKINRRESSTLIIAIIIISVIGFLYTSSTLLRVSSMQKTTMKEIIEITEQLQMNSTERSDLNEN